jgi:hypothetical protein
MVAWRARPESPTHNRVGRLRESRPLDFSAGFGVDTIATDASNPGRAPQAVAPKPYPLLQEMV